MTIPEIILKIKRFSTDPDYEVWIGWGIIILISLGSFGVGFGASELIKLSKPLKIASGEPLVVFQPLTPQVSGDTSMSYSGTLNKGESNTSQSTGNQVGSFLASKSGKVYYPSSCKSSNRIKEENRIYFKSSQEAERAGYTLSKLCD